MPRVQSQCIFWITDKLNIFIMIYFSKNFINYLSSTNFLSVQFEQYHLKIYGRVYIVAILRHLEKL